MRSTPPIVFITISGYGMTGPYKDMPSHGVAYDTWAGLVNPGIDDEGFAYIPEHPSMGIHAGPLFGALGILAGVIRAREHGRGLPHGDRPVGRRRRHGLVPQRDVEGLRAARRPRSPATSPTTTSAERPGTAGMRHGVRYQIYESKDGFVLFQASEREFWKNFCAGVGRTDLFERWPGAQFADHAPGNRELQAELRDIFRRRTTAEWVAFGDEHNTPIAPVNTPQTLADDPQFQDRLPFYPREALGAEQLPTPIKLLGEDAAGARPGPRRWASTPTRCCRRAGLRRRAGGGPARAGALG